MEQNSSSVWGGLESFFKIIFALIVVGLLIYNAYKLCVSDITEVIKLQKKMSGQLAGQSVALGVISECIGCKDQVYEKMYYMLYDDDKEASSNPKK